jgi:hypothetical protein
LPCCLALFSRLTPPLFTSRPCNASRTCWPTRQRSTRRHAHRRRTPARR